jgi:hypothetical protein
VKKLKETFVMWLAWKLPRYLVYLCAVRVLAYATTGKYSTQAVPELNALEALKRWRENDPVKSARECLGDPIPISICSDSPDYASLRKQLNDFTSTFYGPFLCEGCGGPIVQQAREQGGQRYHSQGGAWVEHFHPVPAVSV